MHFTQEPGGRFVKPRQPLSPLQGQKGGQVSGRDRVRVWLVLGPVHTPDDHPGRVSRPVRPALPIRDLLLASVD